jgi:bacteriorhodopsin
MIASGAFGALTVGNVKWVWWFFGMCWFLHIIFALGKSWAEAAKAKGGESGSVYSKIAGITVITWFCYPIVWVFAEGFGNFSVTFEVPPAACTRLASDCALRSLCRTRFVCARRAPADRQVM